MGWIHSHINDLFLQSKIHHSADISFRWDITPGWDDFSYINSSLIAGKMNWNSVFLIFWSNIPVLMKYWRAQMFTFRWSHFGVVIIWNILSPELKFISVKMTARVIRDWSDTELKIFHFEISRKYPFESDRKAVVRRYVEQWLICKSRKISIVGVLGKEHKLLVQYPSILVSLVKYQTFWFYDCRKDTSERLFERDKSCKQQRKLKIFSIMRSVEDKTIFYYSSIFFSIFQVLITLDINQRNNYTAILLQFMEVKPLLICTNCEIFPSLRHCVKYARTGFLWPVISPEKIWVRENLYSDIFYMVRAFWSYEAFQWGKYQFKVISKNTRSCSSFFFVKFEEVFSLYVYVFVSKQLAVKTWLETTYHKLIFA